AALFLVNGEVGVVAEQRSMASQLARVDFGPAENLTQPRCEMFDVPGSPLRAENLGQDRIREASPVLGIRQPMENFGAAHVFEHAGPASSALHCLAAPTALGTSSPSTRGHRWIGDWVENRVIEGPP